MEYMEKSVELQQMIDQNFMAPKIVKSEKNDFLKIPSPEKYDETYVIDIMRQMFEATVHFHK